jgi:hypothetical protein
MEPRGGSAASPGTTAVEQASIAARVVNVERRIAMFESLVNRNSD